MDKTITVASVRVMLHRAREQFADLLLEEVDHSIDKVTPEGLEQELADLHLLDYINRVG